MVGNHHFQPLKNGWVLVPGSYLIWSNHRVNVCGKNPKFLSNLTQHIIFRRASEGVHGPATGFWNKFRCHIDFNEQSQELQDLCTMFTYYEQLLGHIYSTAFLAKNNWQSNLLNISSKNTRNITVSEPQEFFRSALLGRHSFAERKWEAKRPTVVTECCYGWNPVNQLVGRCRQNLCMFIPWCQVHHTSNQQSGQCTRIKPKILVEVMSNAALPRMLSQVSSSTRNRLHWRQLLFAFSSTKVHPRPVPINDKASKHLCLLGNLLKWSDMSHVSLILLLHRFHIPFILAKKKQTNTYSTSQSTPNG